MKNIKAKLIRVVKAAAERFGVAISRATYSSEALAKLEAFGIFKDSAGNQFSLLRGFRDRIKPDWRAALGSDSDSDNTQPDPAERDLAINLIRTIDHYLRLHGLGIKGKDILEIGCHGGAQSFAIASIGANHVDAIDIPRYGVIQNAQKDPSNQAHVSEQSSLLKQLRAANATFYQRDLVERVDFYDLDVKDLEKTETYDLVLSVETLEHITDPARALAKMFKALKPGAACFHEYNPFFSILGGHSLCTLDFAFGHVRLSERDFSRYVREYRPMEADVAEAFFTRSLNRMTLADLRQASTDAGFEIVEIMPWRTKALLPLIDERLMSQCRALYPNLVLDDLLSDFVWVLLRRPA